MPEYKNIVFCTDFSKNADYAFPEAKHMASVTGAKLFVIHVVPGGAAASPLSETALPTSESDSGIEHLRNAYGAEDAEYVVLHGHEAQQILKFAHDRPGSLIVIGARGIGILTGLFGGGSVCDKIVRNAETPVLVVPGT